MLGFDSKNPSGIFAKRQSVSAIKKRKQQLPQTASRRSPGKFQPSPWLKSPPFRAATIALGLIPSETSGVTLGFAVRVAPQCADSRLIEAGSNAILPC